ncbi:MAG: tail fiber domain-containing protein, partial [Ferruginibacter sp.]
NDLAIGNGTNAMAIFQTNASTLIGSSTDIVLMPRNNGHGRVGINTSTPGYPLDVADLVFSPSLCYAFFARNGPCEENVGGTINSLPTSIYASSRVLASEFNAYSDARIKNIKGVSNTTSDLAILDSIKITDYTMKDKVKYGDKKYKKVIAQEVEKVYPQVVTQQTDFIPNVYQVTNKIQKVENGYRLQFTSKHGISTKAKRLRLLIDGSNSMEHVAILSIPSDHEVVIDAGRLKMEKVFVYGEEVADFRTVDYEGLTTLNISATQELSKLVKQQQATIDELVQEMKLLKEKRTSPLVTKNDTPD